MAIILGAIGDDFTGSTDLALMLCKNGMPAVQYIGVPSKAAQIANLPAAVVALKTRTAPAADAISQSVAACKWLLSQGTRQIFFKYCSTFDSTEKGNIGPVAEALLDLLEDKITIVCPAFPANARTVYQGHLFVGNRLLSDSSMRHHPLTPMTDADLVRFMGRQVRSSETVRLIPYQIVEQGPAAIQKELANMGRGGLRFAVVDALTDQHLMDIGTASSELKLITGGSGVAMGLPLNFRRAGLLSEDEGLAKIPLVTGSAAVIAGSCSSATLGQVRHMARACPAFKIDPLGMAEGRQTVDEAVAWAKKVLEKGPILIYSSVDPQEVTRVQAQLGPEQAGSLVERVLANIARQLYSEGIRKFIVAGGETSGAVVEALNIKWLRIGPEIEPGVPWTFSEEPTRLCLALKSGNFGGENFFEKALEMLP